MTSTAAADGLFDVRDLEIQVGRFFDCPVVVRDTDPDRAHAAMQAHYRTTHAADLADAVAFMAPPSPRRPTA